MLSNGRILRSSCILLVFAVASSVVARANDPPVAVINFPQSQDEFVIDEIVPFSSTGSNDPDGTIAEYEWTFGDTDQSSEQYPTHSYISPNDYVVQLRVKDNQGQWSPPVQTTIHVIGDGVPIPPQWVFEPWACHDDHGERSEQGIRDT